MCLREPVLLLAFAVAVSSVSVGQVLAMGGSAKVRPAQFSGSWYPGGPAELAELVDELLDRAAPPKVPDKPVAIISPHAGYRFSAENAASGYRYLRGHTYKRVFVLAFSHRNSGRYEGVDLPARLTAYSTPLGDVPIDREVCDRLLKNRVFVSDPSTAKGEHSLELQLPFLQRTLDDFKIVPMLVGRMSAASYAEVANAIIPLLDDETLLVASSDFTHFGPRYGFMPFSDDVPDKIRGLADKAAEPILSCDFDGFLAHLAETKDTICGRGPISLLLRILSMHEGAKGVRAGYDTSGNITNDWSNSVTYQSIVFTPRPGTLGEKERSELLKLARRTAAAHLNKQKLPDVDVGALAAKLSGDGACFVTLENHGRLRGCIGNMVADGPLYKAVMDNAVSACRDRRFVMDPVTASELDDLHVEISYLTPMKRVEKTDEIIVGRHGLLMTLGNRRGVLLPQVASRRGWTREEFLSQTCRKAGLPADAWKKPEAVIYSFEAEVFGEPE